ncbi:CAP domain-containing protein [Mycobacterium sp. NPDC048908]|uniref:CAP domain-containing protein n=1 Tax=Mycobacterium sp. NPDC048908 TaxID=3364292 RepID=UPI003713253A
MDKRTATVLLAACAATVTVAAPVNADGDQGSAVLNQINAMRAANGCGPVAANAQLTASAARQANDMLLNGVVDHTGSDGSTLDQRVAAAGYTPYSTIGEIVFWGTGAGGTPAAAVSWWMNSPGHRAIITDCRFTDAGFSAVGNGSKMTAAGDFGTR